MVDEPARGMAARAGRVQPLLRLLLAILLAAILAVSGLLVADLLSVSQSFAALALLAVMALATALSLQRPRLGVGVLVVGTWLWTSASVIAFSGINSSLLAIFPLPLAFGGWLLGRRWLITLTVLSVLVVLGVGMGEHWGWYQPGALAPPIARTAIHAVVLALSGLIVGAAYDDFRRAHEHSEALGARLVEQNAVLGVREREVRQLNVDLEQRVTERTAALTQALESLQQTQDSLVKAEATATIGALVASVSHELTTPLGNSLMAATALGDAAEQFRAQVESGQVRKSDVAQVTAQIRDGTDLIARNLARAEELLRKFKQVASDQASEQRRIFDLADAVNEVIATLRPMLKRRPQAITVDIPPAITLDSYPGPLGQVVINLVNNAFLHAFEGREHGNLTIRARAHGDRAVLTIEDDGVGMALDVQRQLFKPFFSTKIGHGGTGLGMTIVEGIVRKTLGGKLHVHSAPGQGSRFEIDIPLAAARETT